MDNPQKNIINTSIYRFSYLYNTDIPFYFSINSGYACDCNNNKMHNILNNKRQCVMYQIGLLYENMKNY